MSNIPAPRNPAPIFCFLCEEQINDPYVHYGKDNQPTCLKCCQDDNEVVEIGITNAQYEVLEKNTSMTPFEIGKLITKGVATIRKIVTSAQQNKEPDLQIKVSLDVGEFQKNGGDYKKVKVDIPRSYRIIIKQLSDWMPCIHLDKESASDWVTILALSQTINSTKPKGDS